MGGLHISCGSFSGEDKSGSAFEGVLGALQDAPAGFIADITAGFEDSEYVLIPADKAAVLLPLVVAFRERLVSEIGHDDWWKETLEEEKAGLKPVDAKWGAGRGWRLYCATDLIRACEVSSVEQEPVLVCLC
jgi:hypothetical protein